METPSPTHAKMTVNDLKQNYAHLVERTKQQKQKIEQLLENQRLLQNGIAERDAAIESRDQMLAECKQKNEEGVARMQQLLAVKQNLETEKCALEARLRAASDESQRNSDTASNLQKVTNDYEQTKAENEALLESKQLLELQLKSITDENNKAREALATLGERCQALESQNAALSATLKSVQSEVGATKMNAATSGALCESITAERDRLLEKHEKVRAKYKDQKTRVCAMERELQDVKAQLVTAKSEAREAEKTAQNAQMELDLARKKINEREIHFHNMSEDLRLLNEDMQTNLKLVEREMEAMKETAEQKQKELMEELQAAKTRAEESEAMLTSLTNTRKGNETKVHSLTKKVEELERLKGSLEDKVGTLEKDLAATRAAQESNVHNKYLKKVLLQFFLQDGSTRTALVPVLLSLVDCDETLIQQAQRSWAESNQIISRSFFKF